MIKNTRFTHLVSIFSFILILLVGQTSGYSYVWCFGIDGHTVLEQAHDSACGEHKSKHDVLTLHPDSSEYSVDHCGPCLDLLPSSSYASNRLRDVLMSLDTLVLAPSLDEHFLRVASLPLQPQSVVADFVPRIRDQILHHRTIVMLN